MKKLVLVLSCMLLLDSTPVWAAEDPSVVVVRVVEAPLGSSMTIVRGSEQTQTTKLKNGAAVVVAYQRVVTELYAQGYTLQSTLSAGDGALINSTLIFVKAPTP